MNVSVLCKVVDNFGDIGVAWRLCRQFLITKKNTISNKICLIVDDLISFNKIDNRVKTDKSFQVVDGIEIYDWKDENLCHEVFSENDGEKLSVILELFQCGRPDWMEKILFDEKLERTVHIVMIDYLTAEKYAEDFHLLESLTRSKRVQKVNFMPGFTEKTGGLVIDDEWKTLANYDCDGPILVFTYERNWTGLVKGIAEANQSNCKIMVAQGRGKESFVQSWKKNKSDDKNYISNRMNTFELEKLPYLNQPEWDKMMKKCSVLFIRGEESMSRACLSGIPFVWHAYPQSEEYQLVKVNALLDRMERHFEPEFFGIIKNVFLDFNLPENEVDEQKFQSDVTLFINSRNKLQAGYKAFAKSLLSNGDLCENLIQYIQTLEKSL